MCVHVARRHRLVHSRLVGFLTFHACNYERRASCLAAFAWRGPSLGRVGSELAQRLLLALFSRRVEAAEPEPISAALLLKVEALGLRNERKMRKSPIERAIDLRTHFNCTHCPPFMKLGIHRFHDKELARSFPD